MPKNAELKQINDAFLEPDQEEQILFSLPVTKPFLHQVVLGVLSICKGSYRGVQEVRPRFV